MFRRFRAFKTKNRQIQLGAEKSRVETAYAGANAVRASGRRSENSKEQEGAPETGGGESLPGPHHTRGDIHHCRRPKRVPTFALLKSQDINKEHLSRLHKRQKPGV